MFCVFAMVEVLAWLVVSRKRENDTGADRSRLKEKRRPSRRLLRSRRRIEAQNFAFAVTRNVRPRPVSTVLPAIVLEAGV